MDEDYVDQFKAILRINARVKPPPYAPCKGCGDNAYVLLPNQDMADRLIKCLDASFREHERREWCIRTMSGTRGLFYGAAIFTLLQYIAERVSNGRAEPLLGMFILMIMYGVCYLAVGITSLIDKHNDEKKLLKKSIEALIQEAAKPSTSDE